MPGFSWDEEATAAADYAAESMFEAHRGAIAWRVPESVVIFGNDDYSAEDSKAEVRLLRESLESEGFVVLGFGVDRREGYSWAFLVRADDVQVTLLNEIVHSVACELGLNAAAYQAEIAGRVVYGNGLRANYSAN